MKEKAGSRGTYFGDWAAALKCRRSSQNKEASDKGGGESGGSQCAGVGQLEGPGRRNSLVGKLQKGLQLRALESQSMWPVSA